MITSKRPASAPSQVLLCSRPPWAKPASYRDGRSCAPTPRTCSSDGSNKRGCRLSIRLTRSGRPGSRNFLENDGTLEAAQRNRRPRRQPDHETLFCSEDFPAFDILDHLDTDQLWALLSMRVQLADSDHAHALSAAVRFGGLGCRYILVVFDDRPVGLLSHADGSGLFPEARLKLIALSWEENPPRLDAGYRFKLANS
jgi:hypothetical protein